MLLFASAAAAPLVAQDVRADDAPLHLATRGLVHDASPRLGYDLEGLQTFGAANAPKPFRLSYAGFDAPSDGREWPELETAHKIAGDILYDAARDVATMRLAAASR